MKYRGADGWLYDDSVQKPQRMQKKEKLDSPASPKGQETTYEHCPNCEHRFGWRQMEQRCIACGWQAKQEEQVTTSSPDGGACVALLAVVLVPTPVFAGVGMVLFGFGGLVAGIGLGLLGTLGILGAAMIAASKENKPRA